MIEKDESPNYALPTKPNPEGFGRSNTPGKWDSKIPLQRSRTPKGLEGPGSAEFGFCRKKPWVCERLVNPSRKT